MASKKTWKKRFRESDSEVVLLAKEIAVLQQEITDWKACWEVERDLRRYYQELPLQADGN